MRVLWFTNVPLPPVAAATGVAAGAGGHWMAELFHQLAGRPGLALGVATAFPGLPDQTFEADGATFYCIGQPRRSPTFTGRRAEIDRCAAIAAEFAPDLIHFHGSERFFGLIKAEGLTRVPAVLSLQGVLGPYSEFRNFFGALGPMDALRSTRLLELPLGMGLWWQYRDMRRAARQEARIIGAMDALIGRTDWDRAWARTLNPGAPWFPGGEILRAPFYAAGWDLDRCDRHALVYTNAGHPRRGTENLLAAVARLRADFPSVRLRLAGVVSGRSGYGRFLRGLIRDLRIEDRVDFLGHLDGPGMVEQLLRAHVFVLSSYLENSPNSLAEAMVVGMPCVASYVGGVPSMVADGRTGLLYPVDDVALLAERIRQVFADDDRARALGAAARREALARHDPATVADQVLAAYGALAGDGRADRGGARHA